MQLVLAVQQDIGGTERITDGEAERGALRHAHLHRIEGDAQIRARRPRTLAAVARREETELARQALFCRSRSRIEQAGDTRRDGRVSRRRRIEDVRAIIGVSVAIHVARDARREGTAAREAPEPVDTNRVIEVVADAVRDLVARVELAARPLDGRGVADSARESARLLAVVGDYVRQRVSQVAAEARREQRDAKLLALAAQIRTQLADTGKELADTCVARRDGTGCRDDAGVVDVDRTPRFTSEVEANDRSEVEIEEAALVHVHAVRAFDGHVEPVVEHRAVPLEVAAHALPLAVVLVEQRDVRRVAGEHAAVTAVGASRRDVRRIGGMQIPLRNGRGGADAVQLLHGAGQTGVVDGRAERRCARHVLEEANATAHNGTRSANGAVERGDLRRFTVRVREAEARTHIESVRHHIVAHAEQSLHIGVVGGRRRETIAVEPYAVLELEVGALLVRVAERQRADGLAGALQARRELARVECRTVGLEVGE